MKEEIIKEFKDYEFICDICGKKVIQDGTDIVLLRHPKEEQEYSYHTHASCLVEFLRKNLPPLPIKK